MRVGKFNCIVSAVFVLTLAGTSAAQRSAATDPLPSWNDNQTKQAIIAFVERVTKEGDSGYVPPAQRVATFDNDGYLWAAMYFSSAKTRKKLIPPQKTLAACREPT